jgi:hypothetical protein
LEITKGKDVHGLNAPTSAKPSGQRKEPDLIRLNGDEVVYAFTQTLRRAVRPTFSLLEPHREQDLSANPNRTANQWNMDSSEADSFNERADFLQIFFARAESAVG